MTYEGFDQLKARQWVGRSLERGHALSAAVLQKLDLTTGRIACILPTPTPALRGFEMGGLGSFDEEPDLADFIERSMNQGAHCLLIEDEMASRGDSAQWADGLETGFIGDRVVHWRDLESPPDVGNTFSRASSGYPTNAFLLSSSSKTLGLRHHESLTEVEIMGVVASVQAIIVAAFDAESFVIWEHDQAR